MKTKSKQRIGFSLASVLLVLGFICSNLPSAAATNKILIADNDKDGKISIGDKFCLGDECFYVTKNADEKIMALAEYNLYTGYTVHDVTEDEEYWKYWNIAQKETFFALPLYEYLSKHDYAYCQNYYTDASVIGKSVDNSLTNISQYVATYCYQPLMIDYEITTFQEFDAENNRKIDKEFTYLELEEIRARYDYCNYYAAISGYYIRYCENWTPKNNEIKQSNTATSMHGTQKGDYSYPEVANHYFTTQLRDYLTGEWADFDMVFDYNGNLLTSTYDEMTDYAKAGTHSGRVNPIYEPVFRYENYLKRAGYAIESIDLLSYNDLVDIMNAVNNQSLTFVHDDYQCNYLKESWGCETESPWWDSGSWHKKAESIIIEDTSFYSTNLASFLPESQNWLYATTYWLKTTHADSHVRSSEWKIADNYWMDDLNRQFFIDSFGDLSIANGNITNSTNIGAGIRPVITMAANLFELNSLNLSGTVHWIGDSQTTTTARPLTTTIRLYQNGVLVDSVEVAEDADNAQVWTFAFAGWPKYDAAGELYKYTVTQDDIAQYESNVTGFEVTNTYIPQTEPDPSKVDDGSAETANPKTLADNPALYGGILAVMGGIILTTVRRGRR